jgi:hypothetical protein
MKMAEEKTTFSSWAFVWALIDTFVNILALTAVSIILAAKIKGFALFLIILVFILWSFRPMYLAFKEFIQKFPKKKPAKEKMKWLTFINILCYFLTFAISILIFLRSVIYLNALAHPLVLSFSFIASALIIIFYHHISKKVFSGPIWTFSKFFFLSTIVLIISVLFFSSFGLSEGHNDIPKNLSFNVYVLNDALTQGELHDTLSYSSNVWNKYNISLSYDSQEYKEVNLSAEETLYLFNNGSVGDECLRYTQIIKKVTGNSSELSLIFLKNINSSYAGRGCICNCTFALVSPEKLMFLDFTGWNTAHEIGHILGLSDTLYQIRFRKNLMNDETKRLLFFNSDFLDQTQVNTVIKSIESRNETTNKN